MRFNVLRRMRVAAAVLLAAVVLQPFGPPGASAVPAGQCEAATIPVTLLGSGSPTYTVRGTLCMPLGPEPEVVQLLLHGGTYNRGYFDFGYKNAIYSYQLHAMVVGYATFNLDFLGHGTSDHPVSTDLTMQNQAYVVHQVVQALRTGVNGESFDWVQAVGHSLGSLAAAVEAATYADVDSLILTGEAHVLSPSGGAVLQAIQYPANNESQFASLDSGYFTTLPGHRADAFYHSATASTAVIAQDDATKDTVPLAELLDLTLYNLTSEIEVPVLVVNGEFDLLLCGSDGTDCSTSATMQAAEDPYFDSAACMRALSIPDTGHDVQLHRTVLLSNALMLAWSVLVTGGGAGNGTGCTALAASWSATEASIMLTAPMLIAAAAD